MIYPEWVCQLIAKTVCSQLRHEYAGTCRSVECLLVKLVDVKLVVEYHLCVVTFSVNLMTGRTCGDSVPDVAASMYSMVCVESIWM